MHLCGVFYSKPKGGVWPASACSTRRGSRGFPEKNGRSPNALCPRRGVASGREVGETGSAGVARTRLTSLRLLCRRWEQPESTRFLEPPCYQKVTAREIRRTRRRSAGTVFAMLPWCAPLWAGGSLPARRPREPAGSACLWPIPGTVRARLSHAWENAACERLLLPLGVSDDQ
jgi:hypothetical protein